MKRFLTLTFLFVLCFATTQNTFAAAATAPSNAVVEIPATNSKLTKKQLRKQAKQEKKIKRQAKFVAWLTKAKSKAGDNQIVAILLAFFLGGLGIHRVYLGSKPILILGYLLTFGGFFGIIPLIDFIRLIVGGTSHYENRDGLFACFG